ATQPPSGAVGPASYVKAAAAGTRSMSGNNTLVLTVPAGGGVVAGHRVVVAAAVGTFGGTVTCRDSRGNAYAIDGRTSTNNLFVCSANATAALQPGDTITVTYPAFSGASAATAYEFAGIAPVSPNNGARQGGSTSTRLVSVSPALATTTSTTILFGAVGSHGTFAGNYGFTTLPGNGGLGAAFRIVTSTGSYSSIGTVGSGSWRSELIAYRVG